MIEFFLSKKPFSTNRIWRAVNGRVYRSREYMKWREEMAWEINDQGPFVTMTGPITAQVLVLKSSGTQDLDNRLKSLFDLCTYLRLIEDDRQIQRIESEFVDMTFGSVVRLTEYKGRGKHGS